MSETVCPLLGLASELRISIYEHLFSEAVITYTERFIADFDSVSVATETSLTGSTCHVATLGTCKRIRKEAHPVLARSLLLKINFVNNMTTMSTLPQALSSYLSQIRYVEFKADTGTDVWAGGLKFDVDKFPNLSTLTYVYPSPGESAPPQVFVDDTGAVAWLEGKHDHALLQRRVDKDAEACHIEPEWPSACQHWYHELLTKRDRGYRLQIQRVFGVSLYRASAAQETGAEGYYGVPVNDPKAIGVRRYIKLVYNADNLDIVATAYDRCYTRGNWNDEIKELCADRNRQRGVWKATPFRVQHERGLWRMPS